MALVIMKEDAELLHQVNMALREYYNHNSPLSDLLSEDQVLLSLEILINMWRHLG